MTGYTSKVVDASRELSAREKVMMKDTSNCIRLDEETEKGKVIIDLDFYVVLGIHNEKSEDKDYENYVVIDKDGTKYVTGSQAFFSSLTEIVEEMYDAGETDIKIEVYRKDSKNYKGKQFITCSLV